jgi:hypothetical protein
MPKLSLPVWDSLGDLSNLRVKPTVRTIHDNPFLI